MGKMRTGNNGSIQKITTKKLMKVINVKTRSIPTGLEIGNSGDLIYTTGIKE